MTKEIPPKPEKPTPAQCCGSGCNPCIFDYYYRALEEWEKRYRTNGTVVETNESK